ncbi:hypothetical protein [Streptomyces sp. NPDC057939]|uniref:hypothetical protein n=1 Tax=Streptomyces sp. NPDC057939 TaxID=3346284 RepID=UPI0036E29D44
MNTEPYETPGAADAGAAPAATGLALLAAGGWLLTTTRPWNRPGHPLALGLEWTASAALLLTGLLLLAHGIRAVHGHPNPPTEPGPGT